jgi:hypothetical protein
MRIVMDTLVEERREALESVLDALRLHSHSEGGAACLYLLRHLLRTANHPAIRFEYDVSEEHRDERSLHPHPFS